MSLKRSCQALCLLLFLTSIVSFSACRSETNGTTEGLIVVNAPITGQVRRVLVSEETNVPEKATLIEIAVVSNIPDSSANENRTSMPRTPDVQAQSRIAEEELQRASIELQRIEPLVAANNAPQSHLDAARAQYQQAQEKLDRLRRQPFTIPPTLNAPQGNVSTGSGAPKETIVAVPAPIAGNVRVINVRSGQFVKAGQAVATISTKQ
jgi:multidrug efflux pump subunit AcrA (membrane-fusion protein)